MLYITTKEQKDAHTAYKTLVGDCAADGGLYIPFRITRYEENKLRDLKEKNFGEVVAEILNYFFSAQLTAWDVEFAIGRTAVKNITVGRKIIISELWHNHEATYRCLERNLFRTLSKNGGISSIPTDWARIAIRIAILFGIYSDLRKNGIVKFGEKLDIAMDAGVYFEPVAACLAQKMGLPLGKIIVSCNGDNAIFWDLVHRDGISTVSLKPKISLAIERLLHIVCGEAEMMRFAECCNAKCTYTFEENTTMRLSDIMACIVVSDDRLGAVVNGVLKTDNYRLDAKAAASVGAIQDYRSKAGESNLTLVFSENKPI